MAPAAQGTNRASPGFVGGEPLADGALVWSQSARGLASYRDGAQGCGLWYVAGRLLGRDAPKRDLADVKRVFHRLLCWMLVLAIAGLPALAAVASEGDGHAGHAMHGAQSQGDKAADHADHDHSHDHAHGDHHDHHAQDDHADTRHGGDHAHETSDSSDASGVIVHADCVDAACLASCSACSHCQGMPSITGMHLLTPVTQAMSLYSFQSGPPAAALYRPPILS